MSAEITPPADPAVVRVAETGAGKFQQTVLAAGHRLTADEPAEYGGLGSGPSPYDFLSLALAACTSMTLRLYADRRQLSVGRITVDVSHSKIHAEDCVECVEEREGMVDRFERTVFIDGSLAPEIGAKLAEIADKCPVHRTLAASSVIATKLKSAS